MDLSVLAAVAALALLLFVLFGQKKPHLDSKDDTSSDKPPMQDPIVNLVVNIPKKFLAGETFPWHLRGEQGSAYSWQFTDQQGILAQGQGIFESDQSVEITTTLPNPRGSVFVALTVLVDGKHAHSGVIENSYS